MKSILSRPLAFLKAVGLIENWYEALLEYVGLVRKPTFTYHFRDDAKCVIRTGSRDDRAAVKSVWLHRCYLLHEHDILEGATVVDLGAQLGSFSVFAATRAPNVRVYAVEPHPENFEMLRRNVQLNGLGERVVPINLAVSDARSRVRMFIHEGSTVGHTIVEELLEARGLAAGSAGRPYVTVDSATLGDLFEQYGIERCSLLKVDIEGAEYPVLYGAPRDVLQRVEKIYVECEDIESVTDHNRRSLGIFLEGMGFTVTYRRPFIYATR